MVLLIVPMLSVYLLLSGPVLCLGVGVPSTFFVLTTFMLFVGVVGCVLFCGILRGRRLHFRLAVRGRRVRFRHGGCRRLNTTCGGVHDFVRSAGGRLFCVRGYIARGGCSSVVPCSGRVVRSLRSHCYAVGAKGLIVSTFMDGLLLRAGTRNVALRAGLGFSGTAVPIGSCRLAVVLKGLLSGTLGTYHKRVKTGVGITMEAMSNAFAVRITGACIVTSPSGTPSSFRGVSFVRKCNLGGMGSSTRTYNNFYIVGRRGSVCSTAIVVPILGP